MISRNALYYLEGFEDMINAMGDLLNEGLDELKLDMDDTILI